MPLILCLDIGGTNVRAALAEFSGRPGELRLARVLPPWPTPASLAALRDTLMGDLGSVSEFRSSVDGVAAAVAGPVREHRVIRIASNVELLRGRENVDFATELEEAFGTSAVVMNDMEAALAGEVAAGTLQECRWALMDTISTGWGGAALYNGIEVAAEPGHILVERAKGGFDKCGCGRFGCVEQTYSGGAVRQRVLNEVNLTADAREDSSYRVPDGMDPCAFADAEFRRHEPWARLLYHYVASGIGEIWGSRLNLCPLIQKIVYQGTFAERLLALAGVMDLVRGRILERSLFPDQHEKIPIQRATAQHGALLGAARVFLRECKK